MWLVVTGWDKKKLGFFLFFFFICFFLWVFLIFSIVFHH